MPNKEIKKDCKYHGETDFILEGRGSYRCKKCRSENVVEWRRKMKQRLVEYFGGSCKICGYDKYIGALQFHHINPKDKKFGIAIGIVKGFEKTKKEAEKCILVCANCHAEVENGVTSIPDKFSTVD